MFGVSYTPGEIGEEKKTSFVEISIFIFIGILQSKLNCPDTLHKKNSNLEVISRQCSKPLCFTNKTIPFYLCP